MKANSQSSLHAAAQILSQSQIGEGNLQYTLGTSQNFEGNTPTSSNLSHIIPRGQNFNLSTQYKKARQPTGSSISNNNSTFGAVQKKLPLNSSAQNRKHALPPKLALSPLEQINSKMDLLESRVQQAEKKVTNLREVCRLQQDFCDNWEIEQVTMKQKLDKFGGKEISQSSSTEALNRRIKDMKGRKEANPGGDQIYKVLKDKLTEFDGQLTQQMEELEKRLKKHVEVAIRAQQSSQDQIQAQIDKLGEELAFDVNRIEKEAKKAVYQVGLLKKDRSFTEQLLDQQTGVGIQVLQPLRELENRVNTFEFNKANCMELHQLEQKFAQSKSEMALIRKLQKGNSRAIEKIAQNVYRQAAEPTKRRDESTNIVSISGGKVMHRQTFKSKTRKPAYKVHDCLSSSPEKQTLNRGRKVSQIQYRQEGRFASIDSRGCSGSRSRSSKRSKSSPSVSITRQKPNVIEVSEVQQHRKNQDQKFASMLSESTDNDQETNQGSRSSGQRRHKSNGILRHEPGSQADVIIEAPTIVNGTNSSKQVSFVQTKNGKRGSKRKESRPKMMNLDPSTHFENDLEEFTHIEDQVKDDIDFTDQESDGDQMLDDLNCDNEAQSEPVSNQKLQRTKDLLDVGDLTHEDGDHSRISRGDLSSNDSQIANKEEPSHLGTDSSREVFPSRDKHRGLSIDRRNINQKQSVSNSVKPGKKLKLMLKA